MFGRRPSLWSAAAACLILWSAQSTLATPLAEPRHSTEHHHHQQTPLLDQCLLSSLDPDIFDSANNAHRPCFGNSIEEEEDESTTLGQPAALSWLLEAIGVMQSEYFELWAGTWPLSIDWTAAVLGTYVSATLTTIVSTLDYTSNQCIDLLEWDNLINRYFTQLTAFYFGENSFGLRNQAYDDMLWVVLGWLENVKFSTYYSRTYWQSQSDPLSATWHGTQLKGPAAHRARIFYDIASHGYDTFLCGGGMTWNPNLEPYKNAITNELFISASVAMYLYFPGDDNDSPFLTQESDPRYPPHEEKYLKSAIDTYRWLKASHMKNSEGLFMDGFHITGWHRFRNGTINPGTGKCDKLDPMVYTYNQGVLLSGLKGLWIATNSESYLDDGHELIQDVIKATGWPRRSSNRWAGLGRGGVMEENCDSRGDCSQDSHTFKGIFFHHLTEFCRPLWAQEEDFMLQREGLDELAYRYHQIRCLGYAAWIEHNARAALVTRNEQGLYGTWWGRPYRPDSADVDIEPAKLPAGAVDYRNRGIPKGAPWSDPDHVSSDLHSSVDSSHLVERDDTVKSRDVNDRGRGRTVETQGSGVAIVKALWTWQALVMPSTRMETSA